MKRNNEADDGNQNQWQCWAGCLAGVLETRAMFGAWVSCSVSIHHSMFATQIWRAKSGGANDFTDDKQLRHQYSTVVPIFRWDASHFVQTTPTHQQEHNESVPRMPNHPHDIIMHRTGEYNVSGFVKKTILKIFFVFFAHDSVCLTFIPHGFTSFPRSTLTSALQNKWEGGRGVGKRWNIIILLVKSDKMMLLEGWEREGRES